MKTVLQGRELWFDGKITVEPDRLIDFLEYAEKLCVTSITPDVDQYNNLVPTSQRMGVKTHLEPIKNDWTIPDEYLQLDIPSHIERIHEELAVEMGWSDKELDDRRNRVRNELRLFSKNKLFPLLKALIYIINTLKQCDEVWGTGRGSSVSSYVLFILEVHDVDSFLYELDITDFIK